MATLSFTCQTTGKTVNYRFGQTLGTGSFGSVYALQTERGEATNLVCKDILLNNVRGISPRLVLQTTLNEIKILKQLGHLKGYKRMNDRYYIVMDRIRGQSKINWFSNRSDEFAKFSALRRLHRRNVAHFDAHDKNFIFDTVDPNKATAIDFGFAEEATYTNSAIDAFILVLKDGPHTFNLDKLPRLFKFYVSEMLIYAYEHKFETCQQILLMGAVTLAALYGIPALAVSHLLVQEFIRNLLIAQLGKELTSKGVALSLAYIAQVNLMDSPTFESLNKIRKALHLIQCCLSLYWLGTNICYQWSSNHQFIEVALDKIKDQGFKDLFSNITPELLVKSSGLYFPIKQSLQTLQRLCDDWVMPERVLKVRGDLHFQYNPSLITKRVINQITHAFEPAVDGNRNRWVNA